MNIQQLRQSLKEKWLQYYRENREWLVKFGIWVDCDGVRRPTASFIIATISVLEPSLTKLMPLVVDLNSSPDRVIAALGLNFSPDEVLESERQAEVDKAVSRLLPSSQAPVLAAVPMVIDGVDQFSTSSYMEDMIRQDMNNDSKATGNAVMGFIGLTNDRNIAQPHTNTQSGLSQTNAADHNDAQSAHTLLPDTSDHEEGDAAPDKSSVTATDDEFNNGSVTPCSVTPLSTNPADALQQSITNQDAQCSGRQTEKDEEIWR